MTENNKTIRRISPDELDGIIALIADRGDTELVLLGPSVTIPADVENWPELWKTSAHVYQLTQFADDLSKKISLLKQLTSLDLRRNKIGDAGAKNISRMSNLTSLNLWGNEIGKAGAEQLGRLSNLTSLDLGYNKIGDAGAQHISRLSSLTSLNLWGNEIGDAGAEQLSRLSNLTSLDLGNNKIGDAGAEHISRLSNLTSLDLGYNKIGDAGAKNICCLINLTGLSLWNNQIGKAGTENISRMSNLTALNLGKNQIGNASALHISHLSNLTRLKLAHNKIDAAGAEHLKRLSSLTSLVLNNNPICDKGVVHLSQLRQLRELDLQASAITNLKALSDLPKLRRLDISETTVNDLTPLKPMIEQGIPVTLEENRWNGINVHGCPLVHPPLEVVRQGREAILNYFREIESQGVDHLSEAKVLIVGEGRAGKTSLLRRLYQTDQPLPVEDETTKGIDIHRHDFKADNGRAFRLNVWDFGGQQIYHATHQFFLTKNSLYILLDDTAKDHKSVTDEGFRYWLEVVDLLSNHSPVLIFQNEKGGRSKKIDEAGIKGRFSNVRDVYRGNLEHAQSAQSLSKAIALYVQQLPHIGEEVPAKWVDIRAAIEQAAQNTPFISQQDYFNLYREHLEFDQEKAMYLSRYLHDLGVFLHFQDDDRLKHTVILRNTWATEAVFRILDDETVKGANGRFTAGDCERIWADFEYTGMHKELLALMEKFELCYPLPDLPTDHGKTWLAPQLLSPSRPNELADWEQPEDLVLSYRYDFLPKGLVNRLMVRKHMFVRQPESAWVSGVLFEHDGSSLLAQEMPRGNEITLRARGTESKALMSVIAADLDALNASFSGLPEKLKKLIPCRCSQCCKSTTPEFFEYARLRKRKQDGKIEVECPASYDMVNVLTLLDGFRLEDYSDRMSRHSQNHLHSYTNEPRTITLFLASSKELCDDRDAFDLYFRQQNDLLRKKGIYLKIIRWENFLDAMSETRLQDEYNQKVRDCDIFVSLFMTKTGAYTEEEFDVAYDAFNQNGKPQIYTYFKDAQISTTKVNLDDLQSLKAFQDKLKAKGHYWTEYNNTEHLKQHFRDQIDKLLDEGRI